MKSAVLEGSNMAGVNLRVATIKYANLQNCTLRGAVLAGADLEVIIINYMKFINLAHSLLFFRSGLQYVWQ